MRLEIMMNTMGLMRMNKEISTIGSIHTTKDGTFIKIPDSFSSYFEEDEYVEIGIKPYERVCDMSPSEQLKYFMEQEGIPQ